MNTLLIRAIQILHICIMLFVLGIPLSNSPYLLMLHVIFIPFLWLHWYTNNDTCVLTLAEKYLRNVKTKEEEEECFTCRIINPIFNFKMNNAQASKYIYAVTMSLWVVSVIKLGSMINNKEITDWKDLFVIYKKN